MVRPRGFDKTPRRAPPISHTSPGGVVLFLGRKFKIVRFRSNFLRTPPGNTIYICNARKCQLFLHDFLLNDMNSSKFTYISRYLLAYNTIIIYTYIIYLSDPRLLEDMKILSIFKVELINEIWFDSIK